MANRATGSPPDVSIDADPREETLTPSEARVGAAVRVTEVSPPRTGRVLTLPSAGSPHPNVGSASAAVPDKLSPSVILFSRKIADSTVKRVFPETGQAVWPATRRLRGDPSILYGASHGTVLGADYDPCHKFDPVPNKKGFFDWRVTSPVAAAVGKH